MARSGLVKLPHHEVRGACKDLGVSSERSDRLSCRDARPFLAHHLRGEADERADDHAVDLHLLARWVENLPSGEPSMVRIASTQALNYGDGTFAGGEGFESLIEGYVDEGEAGRSRWLAAVSSAVERFWS